MPKLLEIALILDIACMCSIYVVLKHVIITGFQRAGVEDRLLGHVGDGGLSVEAKRLTIGV